MTPKSSNMSQGIGNKPVPASGSRELSVMASQDNETTYKHIDLNQKFQALKAADQQASPQPQSKNSKIDKVPPILREMFKDADKIFEPWVISIGPYHHGKPALEAAESIKLSMANKFIKKRKSAPEDLYQKIFNETQALRECYDEEATKMYDDEALAWMLFLDGCTLMQFVICDQPEEFNFKPYHISFISQDLLLHENQLPFRVLELLTDESFVQNEEGELMKRIQRFVNSHIRTPDRWKEMEKPISSPAQSHSAVKKSKGFTAWLWRLSGASEKLSLKTQEPEKKTQKRTEAPRHLLELLRNVFVGETRETRATPENRILYYLTKWLPFLQNKIKQPGNWHSYRNVKELTEAGIVLTPSPSNCLLHIDFTPRFIRSELQLPPIIFDDSIKAKLLNLIAYEMSPNASTDSAVTSYVCFLDSLIDHPADVKELRDADIIYNSLGSDEEVSTLFNEIARDLVPNCKIYEHVQDMIQKHYDSKSKTWMSQVLHQHFSTPWTVIAFIGAIIAIIISFVQTYYTIFPHSDDCDGLCKYLEKTLIRE